MSVLRDFNWTSQQRVDVSHLRTLDSSVAADFDVVVGRVTSGGRALVVRGFAMTNSTAGSAAIALHLGTADGIVTNLEGSASGSFLWVSDSRPVEILNPATNSRIVGAWTTGQVNYVGLDFKRTADDSTSDLVQFIDPATNLETPRQIPLARTLDYTIAISTVPFAAQPNIVPIAKVNVDASGNIVSCQDVRPMMFRLGSGGDAPNRQYAYPWADGRKEGTTTDDLGFIGGDKVLGDQKSWMDAVMTRMWEIGGGEYWYSSAADRNIQLVATGTPFSGGESFSWVLGTSTLSWTNIGVVFSDSTGTYNNIADGSIVLDGTVYDCAYIDLDRSQNLTGVVMQRGLMSTLGTGSPPGSRHIIARRVGNSIYTKGWQYPIGSIIAAATTSSNGLVQLSRTATSVLNPVVISDTGGTIDATGLATHGLTATGAAGTGSGGYAGFVGIGGADSLLGGSGLQGTGGAGTSTNSGGYGVNGIGGGGTGLGGAGGRFVGGNGATGGGDGINAFGDGDTAAPGTGTLARGGSMTGVGTAIATYQSRGMGLVGLGGNSTSASAEFYGVGGLGVGGLNSSYAGGVSGAGGTSPLPIPGTGLVGIGGGGTNGGPGGIFFGTVGSQSGLLAYGATGGGYGVYAVGGASGHGVSGLGGAKVSGNGGYGGTFTGGVSTVSGIGGHGVVATGAAGGTTDGYGILATAGGSQLLAVAVPATQNVGYTTARTFYKWIAPTEFEGDPSDVYHSNGGKLYSMAGKPLKAWAMIHLPAGANIVAVKATVQSTNNDSWTFSLVSRSHLAADATITSNTVVLGTGSTTFTNFLSGGVFPYTVSDGSASQQETLYLYIVTGNGTNAGDQKLSGVEIQYTVTQIMPEF